MRTFTILFLLAFSYMAGMTQNIAVTFTGTVPDVRIDSVKATNLSTYESTSLPGDATLLLSPKTGVLTITSDQGFGLIFPNPFPGQATILAGVTEPQDVNLTIYDLTGKIIACTRALLQPGESSFTLSLSTRGIYLASLETSAGTTTRKLICTSSSGAGNKVQYTGSSTKGYPLKTGQSSYTLGYSAGDIIQYRCISGDFSTLFTDSPMEAKNYEVSFPPIAAFTIDPGEGTSETRFTLDASACSDAETISDDLEVRWDLDGDGSWDTEFDQSKSMICQFPAVGPYTVQLEVKDPDGLTDSESKEINITYPFFTDSRDGHVYHYKRIGDQFWMIENLAYLPAVSPSSIGSETEKHYYVYLYEGTDVSVAKQTEYYAAFGVYYNWHAALDACPPGWHLASDEEWQVMEMYFGMSLADANRIDGFYSDGSHSKRISGSVGGKLKEEGTAHWNSPNVGATNSSGFAAIPAIARYCNAQGGGFATEQLGEVAAFWTSTQWTTVDDGLNRGIFNSEVGIVRGPHWMSFGYSVRCIKDN